MQDTFEQLLKRIAQDPSLYADHEERTRQGIILPILSHLGWNTADLREVVPEFSVENGRVDYCLKIKDRKSVYLEAKRTIEDLERHEKQILQYSFADGVELAVLTNGLRWWLYLPLREGAWQNRRFLAIDIEQQEPTNAMQHFQDFLGRQAIATGSALSSAKSLQDSKERREVIKSTIPEAFEQIFTEPDEGLLKLLSDRVESMCGHRPELQTLAGYLRAKIAGQSPEHETRRAREPEMSSEHKGSVKVGPSSVAVTIGQRKFDARSVPDLYAQVLKFLCDGGYIQKLQLPFATSGQRYLISTKPIHPRGNSFRNAVEYAGYYMEAHKSYKNALSSLSRVLGPCGLRITSQPQ